MEIKTETTKTYWLGMTETQAHDLLEISIKADEPKSYLKPPQIETLNDIRQALLTTGLKRTDD